MREAVRLVIWDLDETFWRGTFGENGVEYVQAHHDIVVELCRRGIMNSICSRNDGERVSAFLREKGVFDYFIFPSISWDAKGARLQRIIEDAQLRPATVLFIDDNHFNRAEAAAALPDMLIADERFIVHMLADPRFVGKDDRELTRLKQYKLLESKQIDLAKADGDNAAFLRSCDIRVVIDENVAENLDRVVELIERTNQLNYTKRRLHDDGAGKRAQLTEEAYAFGNRAGLVRVADRYGDYGYVGFYLLSQHRKTRVPGAANARLIHFCFSCRTLGMEVERWVYEYLGRPELEVVGETLNDLTVEKSVDWIRQVASIEEGAAREKLAPYALVLGGCEAQMFGGYLRPYIDELEIIGNYPVDGLFYRLNSAAIALDMCDRPPELFAEEAAVLGLPLQLEARDFFEAAKPGSLFVFHLGLDTHGAPRLRHKTMGWTIMTEARELPGRNFLELSDSDFEAHLAATRYEPAQETHIRNVYRHIRERYQLERMTLADMADEIDNLLSRVPEGGKAIFVLTHPVVRGHDGEPLDLAHVRANVAEMERLVRGCAYADTVDVSELVNGAEDIEFADHFKREVYARIAERIRDKAAALPGRPDRPAPRHHRAETALRKMRETTRREREADARDLIDAVYQTFFFRPPESDEHVEALASRTRAPGDFVRGVTHSEEFKHNWMRRRDEPAPE